ncbi:hypothetical protein ACQR1W_31385 [Bradyrhizobium sp. HKCCYLS1011]|uniref:hypothetical protein n=1 Tax=Bradyrhizobium sp. HKCCYLS1011 TaxID=3420733 RepID=UPI003EB6E26D
MTDLCDYCSTKPSDTCENCGKNEAGISWFATRFRQISMQGGYPDPGNLCGKCAGGVQGERIADEIIDGVPGHPIGGLNGVL